MGNNRSRSRRASARQAIRDQLLQKASHGGALRYLPSSQTRALTTVRKERLHSSNIIEDEDRCNCRHLGAGDAQLVNPIQGTSHGQLPSGIGGTRLNAVDRHARNAECVRHSSGTISCLKQIKCGAPVNARLSPVRCRPSWRGRYPRPDDPGGRRFRTCAKTASIPKKARPAVVAVSTLCARPTRLGYSAYCNWLAIALYRWAERYVLRRGS